MSYSGLGQILESLASGRGQIVGTPTPTVAPPVYGSAIGKMIPSYGTIVSGAVGVQPVALATRPVVLATLNQVAQMNVNALFNAAMLDSSSAASELRRRAAAGDAASLASVARLAQAEEMFRAEARAGRTNAQAMARVRAAFGVAVPPGLAITALAAAQAARTAAAMSAASRDILKATAAKDKVESLARIYRMTPYNDALARNSTRQAMLAAGRALIGAMVYVRPTSEPERLRLRAIAAAALASSQQRQLLYRARAPGWGSFALNESSGPAKINDEFVAITRPLDTFLRTRNTAPLPRPLPLPVARVAPVIVAGLAIPVVNADRTAATAATAQTAAQVATTKLATDVQTAQTVTNPETKAAADKVVATQSAAQVATQVAQGEAVKAEVAATAATQAIQTAQSEGTPQAAEVAQVAAAAAEVAHVVAEQATVVATEVAAVADVARSELEVAATVTNDVPAQVAVATASEITVAVETRGIGPLGVSWKVWGIGAAVLIGGYLLMGRGKMTPNRRRRVRRNRRRR